MSNVTRVIFQEPLFQQQLEGLAYEMSSDGKGKFTITLLKDGAVDECRGEGVTWEAAAEEAILKRRRLQAARDLES